MGYFVLVWGDIAMPRGAIAKWSASTVELKTWSDAKAPFAGKTRSARVAKLLENWSDWNPTAGDDGDVRAETLTIAVSDTAIKVRGRIDEETFREMAPLLGGLLRSTASFGGKGDVTFDGLATRIVIAAGQSSFVKTTAKSIARPSDQAAIAEINAVGAKSDPAPKPQRSAAEENVRARVLLAVAAVDKSDSHAITRASFNFNHGLFLDTKSKKWPTGVLLQCLGAVARNVVEPLARDFLACATDVNQRQRALGALGAASTAAAVDTLIEVMLSPVPKSGAYKSDHLGANWGLRNTKFRGTGKKIKDALARFKKLPKRDADVLDMLKDIERIHA